MKTLTHADMREFLDLSWEEYDVLMALSSERQKHLYAQLANSGLPLDRAICAWNRPYPSRRSPSIYD